MQNLPASRHALSPPAARGADSASTAATNAHTRAAPAETLDALARSGRMPPGLAFLGDGRFEFDDRAGDLPPLRLAGKALETIRQPSDQAQDDALCRRLGARQVATLACDFPEGPSSEQPGGQLQGRASFIFVVPPTVRGASESGMQIRLAEIARGVRPATRRNVVTAQGPDQHALKSATRHREIEAQLLAQGFDRTPISADTSDRPWEPEKQTFGYLKTFFDADATDSDDGGSEPGASHGSPPPEAASAAAAPAGSQPVRTSSARARQRAKDRKATHPPKSDPAHTWAIQIAKLYRPKQPEASPSGVQGKAQGGDGEQKVGRVGLHAPAGGKPKQVKGPTLRTSIVTPHNTPPDWSVELINGEEVVRVSLNVEGHSGPSDPRWPRGVHVSSEFLTEGRVLQLLAEGYTALRVPGRAGARTSRREQPARKLTVYIKQEVVDEATGPAPEGPPAGGGKPDALTRQQKATLRKRAAQRRAVARQPGGASEPAATATASVSSPPSPAALPGRDPGADGSSLETQAPPEEGPGQE